MNTGIQDAVALGRALADVLGGRAGEGRLDQYERTRRPVAQRVVSFTDRMTRVATLRTRRSRAMRNAVMGVVSRIPAVRRTLAMELAGLRAVNGRGAAKASP
jgi:2-polyprenyl-6-methoxyphenol hydroxylase-like FAD-dependent oxidoreductase